ncbi:natterin-3-like [Carassius auratus]|uniref:Natterin-3-like n=1 Tax=Carassius auratus TaxID=7957 RepID=A0A6P6MGU6_CARAU|nr:natterin-3-like [Carassius auratus]
MKLLVCAIIALLQLEALCVPASDKSSLQETEDGAVPLLGPQTPPDLLMGSQVSHSRVRRAVEQDIKWVTWNYNLPSGAIAIYNDYAGRTDYVCRSGCNSGFYSRTKGPYCHYPYGDKEYRVSSFDVLVLENSSGGIKWEYGSYGSVPVHAVRVCSEKEIYVGKNKYGLGKVDRKNTAFFLPWNGSEYWYKQYQVLAYSYT